MPRIVVVVAVGMSYGIMRARLVVLKLIGVVLLQRRVEILLLVCCTFSVSYAWLHLLSAHEALDDDLLLLAVSERAQIPQDLAVDGFTL